MGPEPPGENPGIRGRADVPALPAGFRHGLSELRTGGQRLAGQRAAASPIAATALSRVQVKTRSWPVGAIAFPRREASRSSHSRALARRPERLRPGGSRARGRP